MPRRWFGLFGPEDPPDRQRPFFEVVAVVGVGALLGAATGGAGAAVLGAAVVPAAGAGALTSALATAQMGGEGVAVSHSVPLDPPRPAPPPPSPTPTPTPAPASASADPAPGSTPSPPPTGAPPPSPAPPAAPAAPAPPPPSAQSLEHTALSYFEGQGWTRAQAAGLVGNLVVESNLRPGALGDQGQALGIAQWHPPRQREFERVVGHPLGGSSLEEQLQFVQHELRHGEARAAQALRQAGDARAAAEAVDQFYERSSGAHRQRRVEEAERICRAAEAEQRPQ